MFKASIKLILLFVVMLVFMPAYSYAQCSSPAGVSGEREWSSGGSVYQLCDGTNWVDFSCKSASGCIPTSIAYETKLTNGTNLDQIWGMDLTDDGNTLVAIKPYGAVVVMDVSSPPAAPTILGVDNDGAYNDGSAIETYGDYAFITSRYGSKFVAVDFSTPSSPSIADTLVSSPTNEMTNIYGLGLTPDGQYAVTTSWDSGSGGDCHIHVIDISTPGSLVEVGNTDFSGVSGGPVYCVDAKIYGDYAFVAFDEGGGGLGVVDISTKSAPVALSYTSMASGTKAQTIEISSDGQYAFLGNYDASVSSFDISTPTSPSYSDNYTNSTYLDGVYDIAVLGDVLIATGDVDDGLVVLDVSDPTSMTYIDDYASGTNIGGANPVEIQGRYAYVIGSGSNSAAVFDLGCDTGGAAGCNTLGACSTSAEMEWDGTATAFKYCDGSDWVEIGCNSGCATLGACSTAGEITYSGSTLFQCDGSTWQAMIE